ncbi:DNA methylase [Moesziomyces antarcticus]|uniref:DNA methylase n=1 Tax=Pseudozyma antarctica TaxID=84753 RepID=UPI00071981F9|nr:DNA methylase [Moesziomyces antarcticus]GAK62519.1 DNA methylase [Moesziomyces antarcticus]
MVKPSSFSPSALEPTDKGEGTSKTPSPARRTVQCTLFNVKFGAHRTRLPPVKAEASPTKRTRSQYSAKEDEAKDETEEPSKRSKPASSAALTTTSAAPEYHHRGPFHQVTRPEFCSTYEVEGLPDAEIYYKPDFISAHLAEEWRAELDRLSEWYRPKLKVYGREITQSRDIAAYSTAPGLHLKYSGHPVELHAPFPPLLNHIASLISSDDCLGSEVRFNHCMLNRYEDGSIYIGRHSDNIENKVIVTVSLGADRSWIMERKQPRKGSTQPSSEKVKKRWMLAGGSLLVMQGQTQKFYTHEIPKELKIKTPRIVSCRGAGPQPHNSRANAIFFSWPSQSITFRQLVYDQ